MNNKLIYMSILLIITLFNSIKSMEETYYKEVVKEQEYTELNLSNFPDEIKLYILTQSVKDAIENNSIFEPFNNIENLIDNIKLVSKDFYNLKHDLIKFAKRYVVQFFAKQSAIPAK